MTHLNGIILSLIIFTPLAGALVLALLPDRGRIQQWAALLVTLITFGLTLHQNRHFDHSQTPAD